MSDALDVYELKAVSWFWSVTVAEVPQVDIHRLAGIVCNVCDEILHPRHVCFQVEAFKMQCLIRMISDLDMLILHSQRLAVFSTAFARDENIRKQLEECGNLAVVYRVQFKMDWVEPVIARHARRLLLIR